MTGKVTLADEGQNYIEFDIICGVIEDVRPSRLAGWRGTKILNTEYVLGGLLNFDLQWRPFNPILEQPIVGIAYEDLAGGEWLMANKSKDKKLYVNPVTNIDHWGYEVDCKGIPFYFDCVNHAAIAASEALLATDKIPSVLMDYIDGAQLVSETRPGSPETIMGIMYGLITIFGDYIVDYGMIAHEATHSWAFGKWGTMTPPDDTDYMAAILSDEPAVTPYGETEPAEDLAEAVRYYVFSPEFLKAKCPIRYDIVERMMTDPSYYG